MKEFIILITMLVNSGGEIEKVTYYTGFKDFEKCVEFAEYRRTIKLPREMKYVAYCELGDENYWIPPTWKSDGA